MSAITQIEVRPARGAHEEVAVWVDHKLVGVLTVGEGEGRWLAEVLQQGNDLAQLRQTAAEHLREAACVSSEAPWLVKDFNVLYRAADGALQQAVLDLYTCEHMRDLGRQLERLAIAFEMTETIRTARSDEQRNKVPARSAQHAATPVPDDFAPDPATYAFAMALGFSEAQEVECRAVFKAWMQAHGNRARDWSMAYRRHLRMLAERWGLVSSPASVQRALDAYERSQQSGYCRAGDDPLTGTLDPVATLDAYERTKRAGEGD